MDNTASNISKEHNPYETILKQNEILSERVMYLEAEADIARGETAQIKQEYKKLEVDRDRLQKAVDDIKTYIDNSSCFECEGLGHSHITQLIKQAKERE